MSGDGLVNAGMVPQIKPELATQAAIGLRTMGTGVKTEVTDFNTDWKGLRAHYSAPEQDAVYTLQDPAQKSAESLATTLDKAAGHLDTFAGELSALKSKFDSLTSEISNFQKQVAGGVEISSGFLGLSSEIVPWYEASETVTQNAHLVARVNELVAELSKAETTCATNIPACGRTQSGGATQSLAPSSNDCASENAPAAKRRSTTGSAGIPAARSASVTRRSGMTVRATAFVGVMVGRDPAARASASAASGPRRHDLRCPASAASVQYT